MNLYTNTLCYYSNECGAEEACFGAIMRWQLLLALTDRKY